MKVSGGAPQEGRKRTQSNGGNELLYDGKRKRTPAACPRMDRHRRRAREKRSQPSNRNCTTNTASTITHRRTRTEKIAEKGEQLAIKGKNFNESEALRRVKMMRHQSMNLDREPNPGKNKLRLDSAVSTQILPIKYFFWQVLGEIHLRLCG